jgi:hypothetical protein
MAHKTGGEGSNLAILFLEKRQRGKFHVIE